MKAKVLLVISAIGLTACHQGKRPAVVTDTDSTEAVAVEMAVAQEEKQVVYDPTDALMMGLKGPVRSVTSQVYSTTENDGELTEGNLRSQYEMTFDQWGHVTCDEWDNEYGYDAEGKFYRGTHTYTTVKRDASGRLTEYVDVESNSDNQDNETFTFSYDGKGRLITISESGWSGHWTEQREYEKDNAYPAKVSVVSEYEGGGERTTVVTYKYSRFDDYGNWTERLVVSAATVTEDDMVTGEGQHTTVDEVIRIEKRTIVYY